MSFSWEAMHSCDCTETHGMSADVIKLSDRRKVARPTPDAFELSLLLISAYLVVGFLFFDAFVAASRQFTIDGPAN
jgi:hypothetical protein